MKEDIRIVIIPTYKCNKNCKYCIYSNKLQKTEIADLFWIDSALNIISKTHNIIQISISGGEVSLLSDLYFTMLYNIAKIYCKKIMVETNFIKINPAIINNCNIINVGYNFDDLKNKNLIFNNIRAAVNSGKVINVKSINTFIKDFPQKVIEQLNDLNIKSWEIIPLHSSVLDKINLTTYKEYEETVEIYLKYVNQMNFAFQNKLQLNGILNLNNYNTHTVYLTPENKFGIGIFKDNLFYIQEEEFFDNILKKMIEIEKKSEKFCEKCTSKLHCMANYFLNLEYTGYSCSGFKELLNKCKIEGKTKI